MTKKTKEGRILYPGVVLSGDTIIVKKNHDGKKRSEQRKIESLGSMHVLFDDENKTKRDERETSNN